MNLSEWTVSGSDDYGCVWITHAPCGEGLGDVDAPANLAELIERTKAHTPAACVELRKEWAVVCPTCHPDGRQPGMWVRTHKRAEAIEAARFHSSCFRHRAEARKVSNG